MDNRSYELYHHGILGQKWGRRNGPPYPLSAGDHSASEKKAGWRKSLSSGITYGSQKPKSKEKFHLTDKQKTAIKIGAAVAATALVAYGGYKLYQSGALDSVIETGKKVVQKSSNAGSFNGDTGSAETLKAIQTAATGINSNKSSPETSVNFVMKAFDGKELESVNCQACTLSYELRRRGLDASARLVDTRRYSGEHLMNVFYKNAKVSDTSVDTWKDLASTLTKMGDGSRGNLMLQCNGSGHSFAYEVFKDKVIVMDTQNGKSFDLTSRALDWFYNADKSNVKFLRTDNLELNDLEKIKDFVVSTDLFN